MFNREYLESAKAEFRRYKTLGLNSIQVLSEAELNTDTGGSNSIAVIVKHLHGNMKSRWTNLFTQDGEKPSRRRDYEFEDEILKKDRIIELYSEGWEYPEKALKDIKEKDFSRPVVIRNEPLTLIQAINRQISHYAYHVGQIVLIAKQYKGDQWEALSIPKGKSKEHRQGTYTKKQ
jgi:hypothetical protein